MLSKWIFIVTICISLKVIKRRTIISKGDYKFLDANNFVIWSLEYYNRLFYQSLKFSEVVRVDISSKIYPRNFIASCNSKGKGWKKVTNEKGQVIALGERSERNSKKRLNKSPDDSGIFLPLWCEINLREGKAIEISANILW